MNKATLTGAMLGGLLMAMPLVQAQTPGPADPIDEQGPALSPPLDGGPGSSGEDPRRRGEDRGREGLPPDTDHDGGFHHSFNSLRWMVSTLSKASCNRFV